MEPRPGCSIQVLNRWEPLPFALEIDVQNKIFIFSENGVYSDPSTPERQRRNYFFQMALALPLSRLVGYTLQKL